MRSVATWVMLGSVFLSAAAVRADRVFLRDGSAKEGTVVNQGEDGVTLKMDWGGISSTVLIPTANVDRVEISHDKPATRPAATMAGALAPVSQPSTQVATRAAAALPKKPGHLLSAMLQLATGQRPDWGDPATLRDDHRRLWKTTLATAESGRPDEALAALLAFDEAVRDEPGRVDALTLRLKGELFGAWLARLRWETWKTHVKAGGSFELKDVTDAETPALIGLLRSHTAEALEPIKPYLPVPPVKATGSRTGGARVPAAADPVLGVTVDNALDIKDKAAFARAVLVTQLKLEPGMPTVDKNFLNQQVAEVQRVLARAADLEGKARAKLRAPKQ